MTSTLAPLSWVPEDTIADAPTATRPPATRPVRRSSTHAPGTLEAPVAIECVPAEQVSAHLAGAEEQLVQLRDQLAAIEDDLAVVEARLEHEGVDHRVSLTLARAVQAFLAELRDEAEEEALALVAAAQVEARLVRRSLDPRAALFEVRMEQWRVLFARAPEHASEAVAWHPLELDGASVEPKTEPEPEPETALSGEFAFESLLGDDDIVFDDVATDDFWADVDALRTRRTRVKRTLTRTRLLRTGAAACVAAAIVVRLI